MKNDFFDDIIRKKTLDHEAPVLPGTWEAIVGKKKKRRYPAFWWIAGGLLLAGITAWGYYYGQYRSKETIATVETENEKRIVKAIPVKDGPVKTSDEKIIEKNSFIRQANNDTVQVLTVKTEIITEEQEKLSSQTGIMSPGENVKDHSSSPAVPGKRSNSSVNMNAAKSNLTKIRNSNTVRKITITDNLEKVSLRINDDKTVYLPAESINQPNNLQNFSETAINTTTENKNVDAGNSFSSMNNQDRSQSVKLVITESVNLIANDEDIESLLLSRIDSAIKNITTQVTSSTNRSFKKDKWAIDISVTPFLPLQQNEHVSYLTRTRTGNMEKSEYKTDKISIRLQPSAFYSIMVHRKMNQRLRLGTGLQYTMIKEKVDLTGKETRTTYHEVQRLVSGSSGPQLIRDTVTTTSIGTLTIDALNSYRLLSVPISIQYSLMQKKRWSLQLNGGFITTISNIYHNDIEGKLQQFNSQGIHISNQNNAIAFDLFAGLRVSKNYNSFRLFAEPVLRYNISRYDLNTMLNRKSIHQAGLSVGITYLFGH